jgi:hypothetical protein
MQLHAIIVQQGSLVFYQGPRHVLNVPLENFQHFKGQHFAVTVLLENTHQELDLQYVLKQQHAL